MLDQMRDHRKLIETSSKRAEAEMIERCDLPSRRRPAFLPELAVDRHEIDQRLAGTQSNEADVLTRAFQQAARSLAVEASHARRVLHA